MEWHALSPFRMFVSIWPKMLRYSASAAKLWPYCPLTYFLWLSALAVTASYLCLPLHSLPDAYPLSLLSYQHTHFIGFCFSFYVEYLTVYKSHWSIRMETNNHSTSGYDLSLNSQPSFIVAGYLHFTNTKQTFT